MDPFPSCICTTVSEKALKVLLETSGTGTYKDSHPWLIALELFDQANEAALGIDAKRDDLPLARAKSV